MMFVARGIFSQIDFNLKTGDPLCNVVPRHQITVTITLHNNYKRADKHLLYLIVIVDVASVYVQVYIYT